MLYSVYWFLLYKNMSQCQHICIYIYISSLLSLCFTHRNVYKPVLLSQSVPLSPFTSVSTNPFSKSASPFLPCKEVDIALLNHYSDELSITRKGMWGWKELESSLKNLIENLHSTCLNHEVIRYPLPGEAALNLHTSRVAPCFSHVTAACLLSFFLSPWAPWVFFQLTSKSQAYVASHFSLTVYLESQLPHVLCIVFLAMGLNVPSAEIQTLGV